jgi:ligand-binding sensor domain-containing protein
MSVDPIGDLWAGGAARSTHFGYATYGRDFFAAADHTEGPQYISNRIDVWPDRVGEPTYPLPSERVDDWVSDMAAMPDGSVWISSFTNAGLAHYTPGRPIEYLRDPVTSTVAGLERDPQDNSLWIGYTYGGFARLRTSQYVVYDFRVLGQDLVQGKIPDIQSDNFGGRRRILVAFFGGAGRPGAIGIYSGD